MAYAYYVIFLHKLFVLLIHLYNDFLMAVDRDWETIKDVFRTFNPFKGLFGK